MNEIHRELDSTSGVALIELRRPPNNFLDVSIIGALATAMEDLDQDPDCRCVVLAAQGKHFCAGRDFNAPRAPEDTSAEVYRQAARLMRLRTPFVAAVQGAAIGAGLGLALTADFRMCSERAYFSANFVPLGLHHGFGLTATLPRTVGPQHAADMLCTGRRVGAQEAADMGLVRRVMQEGALLAESLAFAETLARNPPHAVQAIRRTLRDGLADAFARAVEHEAAEQEAGQASRRP